MELRVFHHFFAAIVLVAVTVSIHSLGTNLIIRGLTTYVQRLRKSGGRILDSLVLTALVIALLMVHIVEVVTWGAFYYQKHCFPDAEASLYFSMITYTTVGFGDVVLSPEWRTLGGVEALTGVLMVGWSTAILLGAVNFHFRHQIHRIRKEQSVE
jgi:hypothetical protein